MGLELYRMPLHWRGERDLEGGGSKQLLKLRTKIAHFLTQIQYHTWMDIVINKQTVTVRLQLETHLPQCNINHLSFWPKVLLFSHLQKLIYWPKLHVFLSQGHELSDQIFTFLQTFTNRIRKWGTTSENPQNFGAKTLAVNFSNVQLYYCQQCHQ